MGLAHTLCGAGHVGVSFLREDGSIEANPAAFASENELAAAVHTVSRLRLNSPVLMRDREELLDALLASIAEAGPENREALCRCAARRRML